MNSKPVISVFSDFPETGITVILLIIGVLTAVCIGRYAAGRFEGNKTRIPVIFAGLTLGISALMLWRYGTGVTALKGMILCLILLYCSYSDIKTRECDDSPHLMIAIAACIGTELCLLPSMLTAALAVLGGLFILMTVSKADVNGADLKLSLACTFLLGLGRGLIGLTVGLVIAIAVNLVKLKNKKEGFPLIPYLAVGYMAAYLI
mgnify:CR=1 FL=1